MKILSLPFVVLLTIFCEASAALAQSPATLDQVRVSSAIPTGNALRTLPPGVVDAAWCFDDVYRNNKRIKDKRMNKGSVCGPTIAQRPWVAALREKDLAKYALAAVCYGRDINIAGIPVATVSAIEALSICQCHNPGNAAKIAANWPMVESRLREWGACAR